MRESVTIFKSRPIEAGGGDGLKPSAGARAALACFLIGVVLTCGAGEVQAGGKILLTPTVRVGGEYTDNLKFTAADPINEYTTTIRPSLMFDYTSDRTSLGVDAGLDIFRHANETQYDEEKGRLGLNGGFRVSERWQMNGGLSYSADTTLQSELEETGIVYDRVGRQRYGGNIGFGYQLGERSQVNGSYQYSRTDYDQTGFAEYVSERLSMSYQRTLADQRTTLTVQPYYSAYYSDTSRSDSYGLSVGGSRQLSERWALSAMVGARRSYSSRVLVRPVIVFVPGQDPPVRIVGREETDHNENWGGVANVSLSYQAERYALSVTYNRGLSFSARGEPIDSDALGAAVSYRLTERNSLGLAAQMRWTSSDDEISNVETRYYTLRTSFDHQMTQNYSWRLQYSYANSADLTADEEDRERHNLTLEFRFGFPNEL